MKRIIFAAVLLAPVCVFAAPDHTAMWFVGHPAEMKSLITACRNDPGRAKTTPDCENAFQAEIIISSAESQTHAHLLTPPSDPSYWRYHPNELPMELTLCQHVSPRLRHVNFCDSARDAMK